MSQWKHGLRRTGLWSSGSLAFAVVLTLLCAVVGCRSASEQRVTGIVVDEHGNAVQDARVTVGYQGWAWEPYLVWDHFYGAEGVTDGRGRFHIDLRASGRLLATVETAHGAIRGVAVSAAEDLRLVTPAASPVCSCWRYSGPLFLVYAPIGIDGPLSSADPNQDRALGALAHRVLAERATGGSREITLTVRGGSTSSWFPDDGIYGGMLNYHPPLDALERQRAPRRLRLGHANGLLILRSEGAYLIVELGTGIATQHNGDGTTAESLLLPARWARRDSG